jgi:glycosyltransferase involved in cell wall biosynthesis
MFHRIYRHFGWKRYYRFFQLQKLFRQRMTAWIQSFSPDVIICTRLEYIPSVLKVRRNIPVVYESHNSYLAYKSEKNSFFRICQIYWCFRAVKKTQMIVALTEEDASEWKKLNPRVQVIPNVVHLNDTGKYSDCSSKCVIFVGRYSYQKDIQSLLQIWHLVVQRHPDWQLHIFGGYGSEQEKLQSQIRGIDMNIVVHAPTLTIYEEYLRSSMLLMTSRYEPFGLVLPEAMSCGLPVVAFDCPYGPAKIISDGVDGFLIKSRSVEEYVDKVCLLMDNQDLRIKMGKEGIMSSQRYVTHLIMPIWKQLFESFCKLL